MSDRPKYDLLKNIEGITKSKMVAKSTVEYFLEDGTRVVRYHDTDIIKEKGNVLTLNSGGWNSVTTRSRINEFVSCRKIRVHTNQAILYLSVDTGRKERYYYKFKGATKKDFGMVYVYDKYVFYDGIEINTKTMKVKKAKKVDIKQMERTKKQITAFIKKVRKEGYPKPSGGDCWLCLFDGPEKPFENTSCLESHLDEGYIHGSLIVRALKWVGYKPEYVFHHKDTAIRTLRRFLKFKFGFDYSH